MKIVLAFGTSSPFSIIVVAIRISYSPSIKPNNVFSSLFPSNLPCPMAILASGTKRCTRPATSVIFSTLL